MVAFLINVLKDRLLCLQVDVEISPFRPFCPKTLCYIRFVCLFLYHIDDLRNVYVNLCVLLLLRPVLTTNGFQL